MEQHSEVHENEKNELFGGLTEVSNDNSAGRIEILNGNAFSDIQDSQSRHYGELIKLGNLEKAPINSLFGVVNRILEESIERTNNEYISMHVGSVLKLIVQEIEQRVSKQEDNMRKQSNMLKSREDWFNSRIKTLETLATGTAEESEIEKMKLEEKQKLNELDLLKLRDQMPTYESQTSCLNEQLMLAKKFYEDKLFHLEAKVEDNKDNLRKKVVDLECRLFDSTKKIKELENFPNSKRERKQIGLRHCIDSQLGSIQQLKLASDSLKQEVLKMRNSQAEDFNHFGLHLRGLMDVAEIYHGVVEENIKLHNEVQDLKGNIRVYCRIRPFFSGQSVKQTTIQYIGENGELVVMNPSKPGKDGHRLFKFNKVFGPAATQEDVFHDTRPLIRSVLDGYNVCIFAYGQTGSGKTYTMIGPNMASVADWGVNYRALNDLFWISQKRSISFDYEIRVQMVEIYNEQVRDLLCGDSLQKRLGIWNTSQPNGLTVPDASMNHVKSTADVMELMNIGLMNRSAGATALNERSSRSHSILTVHVRGTDLETKNILRGCLHLVDLAGSERVDRSEVAGDRLREAQHINKSLSALGDVIFALAQKSPHVPYRNSKLTQVLQSSLGGQAKTLMFVQINPEIESYSETISTLKFAERVSSVELGAARSNREGRGVRELMEQIACLKDAMAKKDEEIARMRLQKSSSNIERHHMSSLNYASASPRRHSLGGLRPSPRHSRGKSLSLKTSSDYGSEYSDKLSETGSQQSIEDFKHHREFFQQSRLAVLGSDNFPDDVGLENPIDDVVLLGLGDGDSEERLSDISDGVLSMGTETDGSINSIVEYTLFPETTTKPSDEITEMKSAEKIELPNPPSKSGALRLSVSRSLSTIPSSKRAAAGTGSSSAPKPPKRWQ